MHEIIFTPLHSLKDQIQAVTSKAWLCAAKYCIKQLAQKIKKKFLNNIDLNDSNFNCVCMNLNTAIDLSNGVGLKPHPASTTCATCGRRHLGLTTWQYQN